MRDTCDPGELVDGTPCGFCGVPYCQHEHCPRCGYTYCDCVANGDHKLCGMDDPPPPRKKNNAQETEQGVI